MATLVYKYYQELLRIQSLCDFEDLIFRVVRRLEDDPAFKKACTSKYQQLFIDEYQDINLGQDRIIK